MVGLNNIQYRTEARNEYTDCLAEVIRIFGDKADCGRAVGRVARSEYSKGVVFAWEDVEFCLTINVFPALATPIALLWVVTPDPYRHCNRS